MVISWRCLWAIFLREWMRVGSDGDAKALFHSSAQGSVSARWAQMGRCGVSKRMLWLIVESMCEKRSSSVLGWLGFCVVG